MYDYLIVGSGLYGATFAYMAHLQGKKCLVIGRHYWNSQILALHS